MNYKEDDATSREALSLRLDAVKEATTRSRIALLACTVAALCLLVVDYNMYLSWNREFALSVDEFESHDDQTAKTPSSASAASAAPPAPPPVEPPGVQRTRAAQDQLISNWVDSTSTDMPLLGSHVNASDATVLGGGALYFLTLWLFYSLRRENRLIGSILRNTRDASVNTMDLVYSGIISHMVFTATRVQKAPIDSLSNKAPNRRDPTVIELLPDSATPDPDKPRRLPGTQLLFLLPPLMILCSITFDVLSLTWLEAPFRVTHHIEARLSFKLASIFTLGAVSLVATGKNALRIRQWDKATGTILRDYGDMLNAKSILGDLLADKPPAVLVPNSTLGMDCNVDIAVAGDGARYVLVFPDAAHKQSFLTKTDRLATLGLRVGAPAATKVISQSGSDEQPRLAYQNPTNHVWLEHIGTLPADISTAAPRLVFQLSRLLSNRPASA